jgi:AcrR family transcriptional regulator
MPRRPVSSITDLETRITDAALALGDSLDAVAMPELARAAGVAVGTLYRVAPSKEALKALVEQRVIARFERAVFAPFPARLDLRSRLALILGRIALFAEQQRDAARYLAARGLKPGDMFVRAASGFARDGEATGQLKALGGAELAALIWGPLTTFTRLDILTPQTLTRFEGALWDAVAA